MSNNRQATKKGSSSGKPKNNLAIFVGIAVVLIAVIFIVKGSLKGDTPKGDNQDASAAVAADVVINKSDITDTAKFYPLEIGSIKMEVLAVKANDGSIRTAFNTCQVCNGSPRAYYKQDGDVLVCQNCGNRFSMDMVEKERGGCNPVPIMSGDKVEDETNINISKAFLAENKDLFTENWKSQ